MHAFHCFHCGGLLVFENSVCIACGTPHGFDPTRRTLVAMLPDGPATLCANLHLAGCNWLAENGSGTLCRSCRLTRTRPADDDAPGLEAFARTEAAKRRLVYQLDDLGLPVVPLDAAPGQGLAFDLLSSENQKVITGHADGVVTIDLAESNAAHVEAMRVRLDEAYRTMLGHLRHEVGHYYWTVLVQGNGLLAVPDGTLDTFRALFGDERADYTQALEKHYSGEPPADWQDSYVSTYATAHPWEDWAETFAHYLHLRDTLQTAAAYGVSVAGPQVPADVGALSVVPLDHPARTDSAQDLVSDWLPLSFALNAINRSMGKDDLYPFVLPQRVIDKLAFVHSLIAPLAPV